MIFFKILSQIPLFLRYLVVDLFYYIKRKGWNDFHFWGLHLYVGMFGACKSISFVRRAYDICVKYRDVTVLTNITLKNFPKDTKIIKLVNANQIKELPDKSLVLIDEIGSIFNSRDFSNGGGNGKGKKEVVPKPVYQFLLQCRHRRIMMLGTVQRWNLLDKQLRDIADTVTVCRGFFKHPFTRLVCQWKYDAQQYDKMYNNPMLYVKPLQTSCYIQTDKLRRKYDTMEMVEGMLNADYISDEEILANRGEDPSELQELDKKQRRTFNRNRSRLGL